MSRSVLFPRAFLLLPLALMVAACADSPEPDTAPVDGGDSAVAVAPAPDSQVDGSTAPAAAGPADRWAARLPEGALERGSACPFECCMYGEWEAESDIALVSEPREGAPSSGRLAAGTEFQADTGFVRIVEVALIAVTDTVTPMVDRSLAPGDTLVLLDYVGEGSYNAWLDGEFVEVVDFWSSATDRPRGEMIGEHRTEWWAHAVAADGTEGWFRADAPGVELGGVDACG